MQFCLQFESLIQENAIENVVCKKVVILFGSHCVVNWMILESQETTVYGLVTDVDG